MNEELRTYLDEKLSTLATKDDIESLAQMTLKGFEGVDSRFADVNAHLDRVESRLSAIENVHVGNLTRRVDSLEELGRQLKRAVGL